VNIAGSLQLGLIYALLALGVFISFRIMNTPDLTADGSFTLGICISAVFTIAGHPLLAIPAGFIAGAAAGAVTGLLQTKGGIHPILAGILTMTALYSINIFVMGGSPNLSLLGKATMFTLVQGAMNLNDRNVARHIVILIFSFSSIVILAWFFKTSLGLQIRATGNNERMVRASSINTDGMRIIALALANGLIALSGTILAQYQGYGDINGGTGIVIIGLASVILGEIFIRRGAILFRLIAAAAGATLYRFIIALALHLNVFPAYMLRFLSAFIVAVALVIPNLRVLWGQHLVKKRNIINVR
jgi:putative ABC transport system permease protein